MASETNIANLALGRLRISKTISDLSERSTPARAINNVYTQCRQEVLRGFAWPFASRPVALVEVDDQTYPGWQYVYQYPTACVMVHCVADQNGIRYARDLLSTSRYYDFTQFTKSRTWLVVASPAPPDRSSPFRFGDTSILPPSAVSTKPASPS